ncbi:molybdopterin-dependent oxidoreductase alpha subunit [Nocardioides albertanoniae]|uniref:Molybdopterin-dependent oxidoreductase alpha subunit n=1 Tax=Nocardioides albertanoniae TaxID=1175486 RepID=A0A543A9F1_9ACTN|nr:FdhF/YdeP family oxidoreductase [Nocardioides albertanoniae]TQL69130.1 molybdopterin-dependent oxidoreductase alpha subunit [Nocardioides albertanoniae]
MSTERPTDLPETPAETLPEAALRVGEPATASVGVSGVLHSMDYALREMGPKRSLQTLLKLNQVDGFDCPSCAWPDPDHRKAAEFCENGAKAVAWEATRKRVGRDFFEANSVASLKAHDDHWLESQGRLTEPMYLAPGATHYSPIQWSDAIELIADRMRASDPDRSVFYTSGRASNEAAFVYQLLARRLGTNNLPDCSNMCHESSGTALSEVLGIGKGTVTYDDIAEHADLILVVGQNPGTNHPRMLTALESAKQHGAAIVSVNPLTEAGLGTFRNPQTLRGVSGVGTKLADLHVPVRVNGDLALFAGINKALVARGAVDDAFLEEHTDGFEVASEAWAAMEWDEISQLSGISRQEIEELADLVEGRERIIVCWAMGLTQHKNSVATIREIASFLLLRGNVGKPGAGASPIRGHSNVQGDRTMGIWEKPPASFLDAIRDEFGFEPPREEGFDTVAAIEAMRDGAVDVFLALGGNFAAATPDTSVTTAALANVGLTVQISTKLNRSHLDHGREALILPCLGRTERDETGGREQRVTVEDSMGMVHASRGRLLPGSKELRSEVGILCALGEALFGSEDAVDWAMMGLDYSRVRWHISAVVPGFEDFEARLKAPGGFALPNGPRDSRTFNTATGRARVTANPLSAVSVPPGHLLLQTLRSHDQFNTTVYGYDDRYRGVTGGRHVVFVNPDDLDELGIDDGQTVDIVSVWTDGERRAEKFRVVSYATPRGCAAAYFPETNVLIPLDSYADGSRTPTSKSVVVRLEAR